MPKSKTEKEIKKIEKATKKLQKIWKKTSISNEALYGLLNIGVWKDNISVFALDENDNHLININARGEK